MEWKPFPNQHKYYDKLYAPDDEGRRFPAVIHIPGKGWFITPRGHTEDMSQDIPQPNLKTAKIVVETMILLNEFPEGFM